MKTIKINLYKFEELSKEAQTKAIKKWYENEEYHFLSEDLTESCKNYLGENKVKFQDLKLLYSLSWSQGDGLCFIGEFAKYSINMSIKHNQRYCYSKSVDFEFFDMQGRQIDEDGSILDSNGKPNGRRAEKINKLKAVYFDICRTLENKGYFTLEYRMNTEEFTENCEANEYTFEEDGTMNNG